MYECYKLIRDRNGFTDTEVSVKTGIRRATFCEWKSGRRMSIDALVKIADLFSCSLDELIGRKF